mgnify:CR=1 FL=1
MSKFYIDTRYASKLYGLRGQIPRWKNMFFARFVPEVESSGQSPSKLIQIITERLKIRKDPFFSKTDMALYSRILSITGPQIQIESQKLNQYNRKRIVPINYDYGDVQITWRDTVDSVAMNFWKTYYLHFFNQAKVTSRDPGFNDDALTADTFNQWGFNLRDRETKQNFFKRIEIYQMQGGSFTRYDLINPYITSWAHDSLGADEFAAVGAHTMNIAYESVQYIVHEQKILRSPANEMIIDMLNTDIAGNLGELTEADIKKGIDIFGDLTDSNEFDDVGTANNLEAINNAQKILNAGNFNNDISTGLNKLPGVSSALSSVDLNNSATAIPRNIQGLSANLGGEAIQGDNVNDLVVTATNLANESTRKKEILAKARSGANALSSTAKSLPL